MTRRQYLRRVGILCCHCLRNLAFYRAGWKGKNAGFRGHFLTNANGNFLDICVLEWCKLFADHRGKHYWKKAISQPDAFLKDLARVVGVTKAQLNRHIEEMRRYRDKFVAHLDSDEVMQIPDLAVTLKSVSFLYDYLIENEAEPQFFVDARKLASDFYERFLEEGKKHYES